MNKRGNSQLLRHGISLNMSTVIRQVSSTR
jgi:hypothetical protein